GVVSPDAVDLAVVVERVPLRAADVLPDQWLVVRPLYAQLVAVTHQPIDAPLRAFLSDELQPQVHDGLATHVGTAGAWREPVHTVLRQHRCEALTAGGVAGVEVSPDGDGHVLAASFVDSGHGWCLTVGTSRLVPDGWCLMVGAIWLPLVPCYAWPMERHRAAPHPVERSPQAQSRS